MKKFVLILFLLLASINVFADRRTSSMSLDELRDSSDRNYNPPFNLYYGKAFLGKSLESGDIKSIKHAYVNLAICYDKLHNVDSLKYFINELKQIADIDGDYSDYLEQKAALSRAYASKSMVEAAIINANEVINESYRRNCLQSRIAAYNSLACAYGVSMSSNVSRGFDTLLKAYSLLNESIRPEIRFDILSRLSKSYADSEDIESSQKITRQLDSLLQLYLAKKPYLRKNFSLWTTDVQARYLRYFLKINNSDSFFFHLSLGDKIFKEGYADSVTWVNLRLMEAQYYKKNRNERKAIYIVDEILPLMQRNYVSTLLSLQSFKSSLYYSIKDTIRSAVEMNKLLVMQDSLYSSFSLKQLEDIKKLHSLEDLMLEEEKLNSSRQGVFFVTISIILLILIGFWVSSYIWKIVNRRVDEKIKKSLTIANQQNIDRQKLLLEISHRIRTPLNTIVGFSRIIANEEALGEKLLKQYEEIISVCSQWLLLFVNNILEFSRIEVGRIKYAENSVNIVSLINKVIDDVSQYEYNSVIIKLDNNIGNDVYIIADEFKLEQIFKNFGIYTLEDCKEKITTTIYLNKNQSGKLLIKINNCCVRMGENEISSGEVINKINSSYFSHYNAYYKLTELSNGFSDIEIIVDNVS